MSKMLVTHFILWCVFGNLNCYLKIFTYYLCGMVLMYKTLNSLCADCNTWNALHLILQIIIEHLLIGGERPEQMAAVRATTELSSR